MVLSSRALPCVNLIPASRAFHSSPFLFEQAAAAGESAAPVEEKKDEQSAEASLDEQLASIKKQLESSEKELKDLKDKNIRLLAEMQNVRTIAKRDVANERQYSIQSFGKSLLCVCDYLSMAVSSVAKEKVEGEAADKTLVSLYQGVVMTQKELEKVLGAQGIKQYGAIGEEFNPHIHEAMFQMELTEGAKPNTLGQIINTGYMFKERVLRPCKAGVYVKEKKCSVC
ncbi:hypothetical protein WA556_000672 [Blastocystis sp. ATCC 50177/Nand II]